MVVMDPIPVSLAIDGGVVADVVASSFEDLFRAESAGMIRLAIGMVDVPERAEEIVQDAFEKTLVAWRRVRDPGGYLRMAVVNGCRSELRRRRVMRRHPMSAAGVTGLGESDVRLIAALQRLTPQRRIAVTLRYFADMSEADVAAAMGVKVGTVKSLVSRGLADLREVVER